MKEVSVERIEEANTNTISLGDDVENGWLIYDNNIITKNVVGTTKGLSNIKKIKGSIYTDYGTNFDNVTGEDINITDISGNVIITFSLMDKNGNRY